MYADRKIEEEDRVDGGCMGTGAGSCGAGRSMGTGAVNGLLGLSNDI